MTEEEQAIEIERVKTDLKTALAHRSLVELLVIAKEVEQEIIAEEEVAKSVFIPVPSFTDPAYFDLVIAYVEDGGCSPDYSVAELECKRARAAKDWDRYFLALLCLDKSCRKALPHLENIK